MTVLSRNNHVKPVVCPLKKQSIEVRFRTPGKVHLPDFAIVDCPVIADGLVQCDQDCLDQLDMNLVSKPMDYQLDLHN